MAPTHDRASRSIGRVAAAGMILCGIVHAAGAVGHWAASPFLAGLTVVVALSCLHCVRALWREPGRIEWVWVTLGSAMMLGLHLAMIVTMSGPTGTGHGHHTLTGPIGVAALSGAPTMLGLLLPVLCLGLAWWALGRTMSIPSPSTSWSSQ